MGMYSTFNYEDVEVTDWEGLIDWIDKVKTNKLYTDQKPKTGIGFDEFRYADYKDYLTFLDIDKTNKTVSFEKFTEMKIISYWYTSFVTFLRDIALFIEGEVYWEFENDDEGGYVTFEDGKVTIHTGQMQWGENTPKETRPNIPELNSKLKQRAVLNKL